MRNKIQPEPFRTNTTAQVLDFQSIAMPPLELECLGRRRRIVQRKVIHNQLSIEPQLVHGTSKTDFESTRLGGPQKARPARRKTLHARGGRKRGWILIEEPNIHRLVHADRLRGTRKLLAGKI